MHNIADRLLTVPNNLPARTTGFIGREKELAASISLLNDTQTRLLTLTGPGGVGKTRLAEEVAAKLGNQFGDGCYMVQLASLSEPDMVLDALAGVLGVKEVPGVKPLENLIRFLEDKKVLLLLDNFEHLTAASPLVARLLASTPEVKIIVTSQEVLRLENERVLVVPPLDLPRLEALETIQDFSAYPAVQLFVQQAQLVQPDFALNPHNGRLITEICFALDGIPLALELAAARIKILPPKMLLARLNNRLKLLTTGASNLPERQKTLRGTIDWSYELLEPLEKGLLARLAVFASSFDATGAKEVCFFEPGLAPDALQTLAEKSLVQTITRPGGEERYYLLNTIREYLKERLYETGEEQGVLQRHTEYFRNMAEEAEPQLTGPGQLIWFQKLELEEENLRAALKSALDGCDKQSLENCFRLSSALWRFWQLKGHLQEGRYWLEQVLNKYQPEEAEAELALMRAKALYAAGILARDMCDYEVAARYINDSLELLKQQGDRQGIANAYNTLGTIAAYLGNYQQSLWLHQESLSLRRELGESRGIAISLTNIAGLLNATGEYQAARKYYQEALLILREIGDLRGVAHLLSNYAESQRLAREYDDARQSFEESLNIRRLLGDQGSIASALLGLGDVATETAEYTKAMDYYRESLNLLKLSGDRRYTALCLISIARVQNAVDNPEMAIQLLGAAEKLRQSIGAVLEPADLLAHEILVGQVKGKTSYEKFEEAWLEGSRFLQDQVFEVVSRI